MFTKTRVYENLTTNMWNKISKLERYIASAKFAVIIILIYAAYMTVGTFFESYYGTDYTGRAIYKHWGFFFVQGLIFLSIFYALLHRMPPKKRLYGFYTVHIGMIILFCGSYVTYFAGIDGNITLKVNEPSRTVNLSRDMLYITDHSNSKEVTYLLPYSAGEKYINDEYEGIKLKRFYPFSKDELKWITPANRTPSQKKLTNTHGSQYMIFNDSVSQEFTMSLHPEAIDFPASSTMGPLKINYLPAPLMNCFGSKDSSGYIIWDSVENVCFTPSDRGIEVKTASTGKTFFVVEKNGMLFSFFPDSTPWPLEFDGKELQPAKDSALRVFSRNLFKTEPQLFLFGEGVAYFDDEWIVERLEKDKTVELPWMGFELSLLHHEDKKMPLLEPTYIRPIQVNNKIIQGEQRSLEIEVQGKTYWVKSTNPIALMINGKRYSFFLGNQSLKLPYELNLSRFKMDTDPGTNNPASYESFVNVFDKNGVEKSHVYMNNPLKKDGFTLYQASYFQDENGNYGSVLSVNFDPGRFWKYLGSLLIVLGSAWHFYIRRSQLKVPAKTAAV